MFGTPTVAVVGGGVAGLTAATFTARADLDTTVFDADESILERNAHLENVPGFPAGVNSRTFLDLTREQAREAGVDFVETEVTDVGAEADGFTVTGADYSGTFDFVVVSSWSDASFLDELDLEFIEQGTKTYIDTEGQGRTGIPGLYAAGRIAGRYHQTVVSAGSGAEAALSLLEDSQVPFYHDWVAPAGYFTGRGREVPPGCEEIDEAERRERERESMERMQEAFAEPHPGEPTMHPSVDTED